MCVSDILPPQASLFSCNLISPSTNQCVCCSLCFEAQIKFPAPFDHFFFFLKNNMLFEDLAHFGDSVCELESGVFSLFQDKDLLVDRLMTQGPPLQLWTDFLNVIPLL